MAQIIVNPQTGERMVQMGGQWIPLAPSQAAGLPPPGAAPAQPAQAEGGLPAPGQQSTLGIAGRAAYQAAVPATVDAASGVMHMLGTGLVGVGQRDLGASLIGKSKAVEQTADDLAGAVAQPEGAKTIADAWKTNDWSGYLANTIGMAAGSTAPMALAAGATAVTGGGALPAVIAAGLTSWGQQAGSMFNELRDANVPLEKAATWSGIWAAPQAVLDVTGLSKIPGLRQALVGLRKAGLDGEAKNVFNRMFRETVKGAGAEMVTEAGQGAIGEGVKTALIPGHQFDVASVAEQGAAGFIGGGALGGPGAVAEAIAKPKPKPAQEPPPSEKTPPLKNEQPPVPQPKPTVEWQPVYDEETESTVVAYVNPVTGETRTPEEHQAPIPTPLSGLPPQIETPAPGEVTATLTPDTVAREDMPAGPAPPVQTFLDLSAANSGVPAANSEQAVAELAPAPVTLPEAMALTPDRVAREAMPAGPPPVLSPDRVTREEMPTPERVAPTLTPDSVAREDMPAGPPVAPAPVEEVASGVLPTTEAPYQSLEQFAKARGLTTTADVDSHIHAGLRSAPTTKTYARSNARQLADLQAQRDETERLYREAIARGEIRDPASKPRDERLEEIAQGNPDNEATKAAQRLLAKRKARMEAEQAAEPLPAPEQPAPPVPEVPTGPAAIPAGTPIRVSTANGKTRFDGTMQAVEGNYAVVTDDKGKKRRMPLKTTKITAKAPPKPRAKKPGKPMSLIRFLASSGGIYDPQFAGELQQMGLDKKWVPGFGPLVRKAPAGMGMQSMVGGPTRGTNRQSLDYAVERAIEAGYMDPGSTPADLLNLLDEETRGRPTFSRRDSTAVLDAAERDQRDPEREQYEQERKRERDALDEVEAAAEGYDLTPDEIEEIARSVYLEGVDAATAIDSFVTREMMEVDADDAVSAPAGEDADGPEGDLDIPFEPVGQGEARAAAGVPGGESEVADAGAARTDEAGGEARPAPDRADGQGLAAEPGAEGLPQLVIPGTERSAKQAVAARDAKGGAQAKAPQKGADEGLFAPKDDGRQSDLTDEGDAAWWAALSDDGRRRAVIAAGWVTGKDQPSGIGKRLMRTAWADIQPGTQVTLLRKNGRIKDEGAKYQRGEGGPDEADLDEARGFLVELAQVDPLFRYARSEKATLQGVLRDVAPDLWYVGDETSFDGQEETGAERRHLVRTSRNNKDAYIFERPGEVWIDVSRLDPGEAGASIYAAVANYAHNNRLKFIGDPMGLSDVALRRRTDQMLSSALKFGTTRHLEPHQRQLDGDPSLGVPPLRWTEGDDAGNVRALIDVSLRNLLHHVPELARARFDASSGTFRTGEGKPLTDGKLRGWVAKYPRIRAASAGSATLKRGILLNTLVRGGSEERSGLLDRVLRQPRQLVEGGQLKRTFYRREDSSPGKQPDAATVTRTLRDLINRIAGTKVGLDVNGNLTDEQGNPVEGRYWRNLISVALDAANAEGTARHEAIHFLKEVGAFPPAIWQALEKQAATWRKQYRIDQRYDGLSEAELNEEAIAEAYAKWAQDPKKVDAALGARVGFNRIQKILTAIREALRKLFGRMPTADEVFARVERGEFATDGEAKAGGKAKAQKDGADLDMSYGARMERARAMGFNVSTTVYHGSPDLRGILDGFKTLKERYGQEDPGRAFFFADDPRVARTYADPRRAFDYQGSEPGVISAYLKMTNPKVIDWGGGQWRGTDKAIHDAKAEGHDGVIIRNVVDDYSLKGKKPTTVRVVFSPEQIRSTDAAFDPKDADKPNIKYDRGLDAGYLIEPDIAGTMEELDAQNYGLLQRVVPDKYKGEVGAAIDRARHLFADRFIHVRRLQEAAERVLGKPLPESMQPYLVEEGYDSRVGEQKFRVDMDFKEPILELMKAGKLTQEQVDKYLTARHAEERNDYIASINPKLPDAGSGMPTAKAKAILAQATPELERIGELVDQMMKQRLDFLVEAGELSPGDVAAMRGRYKHYVPLRGVEEGDNEPEVIRPLTGAGFKGSRANDKRATGRFSEAPDVLATAFTLADEAIIRGQKNIVRKAFYDLFQAAPDPAIAEIEPVETKAVMRKVPYKATENGKTVTRYRQEVDYRRQKVTAPRDGMIVRIDGQPVIVRINHAPLLREIERLGGQEVNALVRGMAAVTQKLSMLNTMWNPEFLFTNAFRDIETGLVNIGKEQVAGIRAEIMKNWGSALKGAWHYQHTGKADTAWSKKMQEFREAGGAVAFNQITDVKQMQRSIDEQIATFQTGKMAKINQARKKLFGYVENMNGSVDNAMRLSVYSALRNAGYSKARAASVSKNLTVNFNRRGELGSAMNSLFMFYNAATQGTAVMLSAMKRPAVRRFVMATVGLGMAQELLSSMLSQPPEDDEDGLGLSPYDRIPEYEKQRNIIIVVGPNPGDYLKIPLFYGYGWFYNIGRLGAAYARGARQIDGKPRTLGATAADIGTSFVQNIVPPGLSNLFVPTVAQPFVELATNKNFFDSPIKPVRYPNDNSPESQRYFPNVNPISREVAQFLNAMTGGDEFTPGLIDISPEAISHVADVYAGAAGAAVVNGWSAIMRTAGEAAGTNTEDPKLGVRDIPFARKLLGSEGFGQAKDATYRRIDALEGLAEREKVYSGKAEPDRRDPKALATLRREHGRELALVPEARKLRRELSAIRKERLAILGSEMPAREQRAKTDVLAERERRLMRAFNQRYMRAIPAA